MTEADMTDQRAFSPELKQKLFHEGYICSYCGNVILSVDDAEVDHVMPYSLGGETVESNAQLLHRHCNREKNNIIDADWSTEEDNQD